MGFKPFKLSGFSCRCTDGRKRYDADEEGALGREFETDRRLATAAS